MAISQGAQANKNGKVFENMMIPIFEDAGFEIFSETETKKSEMKEKIEKIPKYVIKNAEYKTVYGSTGRTEFVIVAGDRRIRIEAKYQASQGSVDEKFPYMLLNGIFQYPEKEVIYVVDGGGYKPGARNWLKNQIDNNWLNYQELGKKIKLMSIAEFMNWFTHEF